MRPLFTLPLPQLLIDALNHAGFFSYEDLFVDTNEWNQTAFGILKDYGFTADSINSLCRIPNIFPASVKLKDEQLKESIPTFCEALDNILNGGIQLESVLQVCGPPGSGKTLLGLQLCVSVQIPTCLGGLDGQALFIDTDSGFSVSRLKEIAEGACTHCYKVAICHNLLDSVSNFSVESILENVHYISVRDHIQLLASIQLLRQFIVNHTKIKVIVVDSLTFPFLTLSNTLDRTRFIYTVLNQLSTLADDYNIAIVVTNHLTTKLGKTGKYLSPSLGESFSHRIPQTLMLGKINDKYSAVLAKSPFLPETPACFNIVKDGLRDI